MIMSKMNIGEKIEDLVAISWSEGQRQFHYGSMTEYVKDSTGDFMDGRADNERFVLVGICMISDNPSRIIQVLTLRRGLVWNEESLCWDKSQF